MMLSELLDKATEVAVTIEDVVKTAIETGEVLADSDTRSNRLAICNSCKEFDGRKCKLCGCFMFLKAALAATSCPIKKW